MNRTRSTESTSTQDTPGGHARPRRLLLIGVQVIGFGMGIVLLGWAVRVAMRAENRDQLAKLSEASASEILLLLTLAALSVGFNGLGFWVLLNPIRKIRATDVISTNAIATFLAYLPFKLSIVSRFVIHNRRDKIPVLTIGAWIAAAGILIVAVLGPMMLMSIWLKRIDLLWWTGSLVLVLACTLMGTALARQLAGDVGISRLARVGVGERITGTDAFRRVHTGLEMLSNPRATLIASALRVLDLLAFALRFYVAARVLDLPISFQDAMLLGTSYFVIGAASPTGMLGTREAGTIGIAELVGISPTALSETASGQIPIAATVLLVTAVEAVVNLGCAGFGIAWLKARKPLNPAGQSAEAVLIERSPDTEIDSE